MSMKLQLATVSVAALSLLGLAACGGEAPPTPTVPPPTATAEPPTPTVEAATPTVAAAPTSASGGPSSGTLSGPAADLIKKAEVAMKEVKSYHFAMTIDSAGTAIVADGDFESPDKARINMDLGAAGKTSMLMIGKDQYMKMPGTESYIDVPNSGAADLGAAGFSNPGQFTEFAKYATGAEVIGDETVDGSDSSHLRFTFDAAKAMQAQAGAAGVATPEVSMGQSNGEMWIEKSTNLIKQFRFDSNSSSAGGTPLPSSKITITYSKFNETIAPPIEKPANVSKPGDLVNGITPPAGLEQPVPTGTPKP